MTLDPHLATLLVSTGIGFVMVLAGLQKNALELRRRKRSCPSCGRDTRACRCASL